MYFCAGGVALLSALYPSIILYSFYMETARLYRKNSTFFTGFTHLLAKL